MSVETARGDEVTQEPGPPGGDQMDGFADPPAWRVLASYVRPYRLGLLTGGVLSLVTGVTGLALPLVARRLVDDLGRNRAITGLGALGGYVLRRTGHLWGAKSRLDGFDLRVHGSSMLG